MYLKARLLQARALEEVKDSVKAQNICYEIINNCLQYRNNTPEKFMVYASKAAEVISRQLCGCKEYTDAHKYLKNVSLVIADKLGSHYVPPESKEQVDEGKVLQDNYYSF